MTPAPVWRQGDEQVWVVCTGIATASSVLLVSFARERLAVATVATLFFVPTVFSVPHRPPRRLRHS